MATEQGEDGQCSEKVGLKRKLTGPPRLLLGKTKTKNPTESRCEARAKRNKTETNRPGKDKHSDAEVEEQGPGGVTSDSLTETPTMDGQVSSEIPTGSARGRSGPEDEDTSEVDDGRNGKANKCGWWRIFSPATTCVRRRKKEKEKSSAGGASASRSSPPEEELLRDDSSWPEHKTVQNVTKRKRRFTTRTFKRFLTSSNAQQRPEQRRRVVEEPSLSFRKNLQSFLTRGRRPPSPSLARDKLEDTRDSEDKGDESTTVMQNEERSSDSLMDDLPQDLTDITGQCSEVVTVTAEMSTQLPADGAATCQDESANLVTTEERPILDSKVTEEDLMDAANGSEMIQTDSSAETEGDTACAADKDMTAHSGMVDITVETNEVPIDDVNEVPSSEKEEVIEPATEIHNAISVVMETNEQLSIQIILSEEASDASTAETTSQGDQPLTNSTTDRLAVLPNANKAVELDAPDPDGIIQEEDSWEASSSTESRHHLLQFALSEGQLVQTARSLVQEAMSAAMEQLSREQQSISTNVHRELQGCRDHA